MKRRYVVVAGAAGVVFAMQLQATAATFAELDPALQTTLNRYIGGAAMRVGRVSLQIEPLVDNGNSVPVVVQLDSPMTAQDHVTRLAIFTEKNPELEVAEFVLSPLSGAARVATRIRLASTQHVVGVAKLSDGTCWVQVEHVIVTLSACIED